MRARRALIGALAAVGLTAGMVALRSPVDRPAGKLPDEAPTGRKVVPPLSARAPSLLYLDGGTLRLISTAGGEKKSIGAVEVDGAVASPDGRWLAEVVPLEATTGGSDGSTQPPRDFVAKPELRLLELGSGRERVVGPGFAPLWAPGSRGLVFLRPQGDRRCSGEVCKGDLAVVYVELATARRRVLLEGGRWGLLSWLGSRVLVSDVGNLTGTLAVSTDGSKRRIAPSPQEVWGGSPDGRWLLTVRSGRPEFLSVEGGVPTGASVPISTGRGVLAEGAWSPDSTRVAAVVLGRRAGRLVTFGPEAPIPRTFAGARGTTGPVLWSPDGGQVVATRAARRGLQVIACRVEDLRCRPLLDYERDVSLVGLTGG